MIWIRESKKNIRIRIRNTVVFAKINDLTGLTGMLTADDLERMTYMSTGEVKHKVELMRKTCKLIPLRHLIA
mgnify:CR=1 FL=1